ncbi:crotonase/enoyl-CoA hydratase family protein [Actibacterium pelagium]|uniref:Enoyl-CoA hydratase n=1 Tax=Actibacterium pelagium TaxID=2029103 RepID=A0A917AL09_9RHOB|nr:crotonase/enoyl-CoA hydratase family protein [Actibacterium pelagium]GGE59858.1 enoyl-CoA hydratase [Actibacterium pelagium]
MAEILTLNVENHVAAVTLNRPDKKNALNFDLLDALVETAQTLQNNREVRAVVLSGSDDTFSAGIDLNLLKSILPKMAEIKEKMLNPPEGETANLFQKPITIWSELKVPVIAAIYGVCFGAGMQLALGADFRIASPTARLSIMEAKWGLIPDMGITQSLPHLLRADVAKELIMTGRVLSAPEAADLGLITRIADAPLEEAHRLASELATRSPDAVQASKALVDGAWQADAKTGLKLEAELQADIMGAPNQVETVMAVMQGRTPVYK